MKRLDVHPPRGIITVLSSDFGLGIGPHYATTYKVRVTGNVERQLIMTATCYGLDGEEWTSVLLPVTLK